MYKMATFKPSQFYLLVTAMIYLIHKVSRSFTRIVVYERYLAFYIEHIFLKQPVSIEVGYERLGPECSDQPNLLMESAQGQYQLQLMVKVNQLVDVIFPFAEYLQIRNSYSLAINPLPIFSKLPTLCVDNVGDYVILFPEV